MAKITPMIRLAGACAIALAALAAGVAQVQQVDGSQCLAPTFAIPEAFSLTGDVEGTVTKTDNGDDTFAWTIEITSPSPVHGKWGVGMAFAVSAEQPAFQVLYREYEAPYGWYYQDYGTGWNGVVTALPTEGITATGDHTGQTFTITVPKTKLGAPCAGFYWGVQARTDLLGKYPETWNEWIGGPEEVSGMAPSTTGGLGSCAQRVNGIGGTRVSGSNLLWLLDDNRDGTPEEQVTFGLSTATPRPGDWDGDGLAGLGTVTPTDLGVGCGVFVYKWDFDNDRDGAVDETTYFGLSPSQPVVGDWDGDGDDDIGVFRDESGVGTWALDFDHDGYSDQDVEFGDPTGVAVPGDWDGDGVAGLGVITEVIVPACGDTPAYQWDLDNDRDGVVDETVAVFGISGDRPVVGDWDGDGDDDIGLLREAGDGVGRWLLDFDRDGVPEQTVDFGLGTDTPVAGSWIPCTPPCSAACAPSYNPEKWNDGGEVQWNNNCYNYANDEITNDWAQMEHAHPGCENLPQPTTCNQVCEVLLTRAECDGLIRIPDRLSPCPNNMHRVYLVTTCPSMGNYHWYRQDQPNGMWSHKFSFNPATDRDNDNKVIENPETANRGGYDKACGYMCACGDNADISGPGAPW